VCASTPRAPSRSSPRPPGSGGDRRFGPGGPWGTNLDPGGGVTSPSGSVTPFPTTCDGFVRVSGPGFDGDMFGQVPGSPATIDRVQPSGTRSLSATMRGAGHIAACDGAPWIAAGKEGCHAITARGRQKSWNLVLR